jgi:hypothetical protein
LPCNGRTGFSWQENDVIWVQRRDFLVLQRIKPDKGKGRKGQGLKRMGLHNERK